MNNFTVGVQTLYSTSIEEPIIYKQHNKPEAKELFPLPKPVLYLLMAALALVGVAYVVVGHLIKDLAGDFADCMLGPTEDRDKDRDNNLRHVAQSHPPPSLHLSHTNSLRQLWDHQQDAVVVPLPNTGDEDGSAAAVPLVFSLLSRPRPPGPKDSSGPPHGPKESSGPPHGPKESSDPPHSPKESSGPPHGPKESSGPPHGPKESSGTPQGLSDSPGTAVAEFSSIPEVLKVGSGGPPAWAP